MPTNFFHKMKKLKYAHMGNHIELRTLPDLVDHPQLKVVEFDLEYHATHVNLAKLPELKQLVLLGLTSLASLPDLEQFPKLTSFLSQFPSMFCCNGFLPDAPCDTSGGLGGFCGLMAQVANDTACYSGAVATDATLQIVRSFALSCQVLLPIADMSALAPNAADYASCDGVKYKQCTVNNGGGTGICYNARLGPIVCYQYEDGQPGYYTMRKAQIALGIGTPCDPVVEAWLGCKA